MHIVHMPHPAAARTTAGDKRAYDRQPSQDSPTFPEHVDVPYFPEGGAAAPPYMIVNPASHSPGTPDGGTANQLVGPADARWEIRRASDEQGVGVDPQRRWPRQFHTERYNFTSLDIMPFPDQVGPIYLANLNRPEKAGWSTPKYGEQYQASTAEGSIADLMQTRDPASMAFAVGWGYVG